jgi:hypothetical protein
VPAGGGDVTLDEALGHVDHGVVYAPAHGKREDGVITSVGTRYVYVRYAGDAHSKATEPGDLELLGTAATAAREKE